MPDAGTAASGAAAAAAASGAAAAGEGTESSRHRHRAQQGEAERPDPGAAPSQSSSGVLGESGVRVALNDAVLEAHKGTTGGRDIWKRDEHRTNTSRHRSFVSARASQND